MGVGGGGEGEDPVAKGGRDFCSILVNIFINNVYFRLCKYLFENDSLRKLKSTYYNVVE